MIDNNKSGLAEAFTDMRSKYNIGDRLLEVHCDVSSSDQVSDSINEIIDKFGRIDALVNNAAEFLVSFSY